MIRLILTLLLSLNFSLSFASVEASLMQNQVNMGETIRLLISQDSAQPAMPNIAPLQKDFNIVGTEQSMRYTVVNGQAQTLHHWIIYLSAKSAGHFTIPPLNVGSLQTEPLDVIVRANQASGSQGPVQDEPSQTQTKPVYIEGLARPDKTAYVHQQIEYTVSLYSRQQLLNAQYSPPKVDNALILPLGEVSHVQKIEQGVVYDVEEQRYLIFPQKSGQVKINPPTLEAIVYDEPPRKIRLEAEAINIDVRPIPYKTAHWLPSTQVELTETFANSETEVPVGTTITRSITLSAKGLPAQLLPRLNFDKQQHASVYAEKPSEKNPIIADQLEGTATYHVSYVFNEPGQVLLPAIKIAWFNTKTGQKEQATLPAHAYTVQASAAQASRADIAKGRPALPLPQAEVIDTHKPTVFLPIMAWLLGFILMGLILIYFMGRRLRAYYDNRQTYRQSLRALREACRCNHVLKTRDALLVFARLYWKDAQILQIQDIVERIDDVALQKELHILTEVLYGQDMLDWNGRGLWQCIQRLLRPRHHSEKVATDLPPMNPS